ncbi:hypothetical protein CCMSSC00406_0007423 [Pleurotus cornucopiae]|uniref:Uncharacterized protein n=1 Tax=Pleurotus cornucopiae TaxID=5321 RepID=A0ACB7J5C7_PLECO|nr:hypothetical protein CCMSSC00406_0007423 [Pleurotus cornucopiae]
MSRGGSPSVTLITTASPATASPPSFVFFQIPTRRPLGIPTSAYLGAFTLSLPKSTYYTTFTSAESTSPEIRTTVGKPDRGGMNQLRKLYIQGWQFAGVYDLLSMFPPTLEELQLDSIKFDRSPDNVVKRELELKAPRIPGVRDCIDRLPYPRAIRALTIDIDTGYCHSLPEGFYPALSDYEMFSRFLCHLQGSERDGGSCLQSITLRIKLSARTLTASDTPDGVEARELAKLEKGFGRLVEDNVLDADLILLIPDQEPEGSAPLMHCSIRRRV